MPRIDLEVTVDVNRTAEVLQLEGMFDVPKTTKAVAEYHFDVPIDEKPWQIGLIVGPSGAGKTTIARHLFGESIVGEYEWEHDLAIINGFGELSIRESTAALSSVGFSSPPSWLKPYRVLSNGEKFRCNLARAIVDERKLVTVDEFTSVIDRTTARVGSHAIAKAVRKIPDKKFVAVSCHDDIIEWLQPDWILEPHVGLFSWRSLQQRPTIKLEIVRCDYSSWRWFSNHHYLEASLHKSARCFVGMIDEKPAAFAGVIPMPHPARSDLSSLSRVVVLPDYQGLGLGAGSFTETIAEITKSNGRVLCTHPSHPALVKTWARSPKWRMTSPPKFQGKSKTRFFVRDHAKYRRVAHFQWVGPQYHDTVAAKRIWA